MARRPILAALPRIAAAGLVLLLAAEVAQAACFADYKAKREDPLRLHYGVMEVGDARCSRGAARQAVARRLARADWQLLRVLSVFGPEGLNQRKAEAGAYFLRY